MEDGGSLKSLSHLSTLNIKQLKLENLFPEISQSFSIPIRVFRRCGFFVFFPALCKWFEKVGADDI